MSRRYGHTISVETAQRSPGEAYRDQADMPAGPRQFVWRGITYHVAEIFATWHLRDRWWLPRLPRQPGQQRLSSPTRPGEQTKQRKHHREYLPDVAVPAGAPGWDDHIHRADVVPRADAGRASSNRYYYRVRCTNGLLCDLYYDAACGQWVLDRVHD